MARPVNPPTQPSLGVPPLRPYRVYRFWAKVARDVPGCWIWLGAKNRLGYGRFGMGGRQYWAHRVAYAIAHLGCPPNRVIMHSCDNPSCVRPDHLRAGFPVDNVRDCVERGRTAYQKRLRAS